MVGLRLGYREWTRGSKEEERAENGQDAKGAIAAVNAWCFAVWFQKERGEDTPARLQRYFSERSSSVMHGHGVLAFAYRSVARHGLGRSKTFEVKIISPCKYMRHGNDDTFLQL